MATSPDSSRRVEMSKDTLEIMRQEGSDILNRQLAHSDALQSKNMALLGFVLVVTSLVPTFLLSESKPLTQFDASWLFIGYFALSIASIICGVIVFRAKKYGEVASFDDKYFWDNMAADSLDLSWILIEAKQTAIKNCKKTHASDVRFFKLSLGFFVLSIAALLLFIVMNAHS